MPKNNEEGQPIASSGRNKKTARNKGTAERKESMDSEQSAGKEFVDGEPFAGKERSIEGEDLSQKDMQSRSDYTGPINPVQYLKGRGAQFNPKNRFLKNETVKEHIEAIDDWIEPNTETEYLEENAKGIVNKVDSPDVGMWYSMNPYQGCEHGCTYCYARNVHEYWGYSAGLDFERKIIVKKNAPALLRKFLMNPKWEPVPISLSGNTDCYQPAEKKIRHHAAIAGSLPGVQPACRDHYKECGYPAR